MRAECNKLKANSESCELKTHSGITVSENSELLKQVDYSTHLGLHVATDDRIRNENVRTRTGMLKEPAV